MPSTLLPSPRRATRRHRPVNPPTPVFFIAASDFEQLTREQLEAERPDQLYRGDETSSGHASQALLTPLGEHFLFRKMNFLRALAARQFSLAMSPRTRAKQQAQSQALIQEANGIRQQILQANLRLVTALARKATSNPHDFDDYASEGAIILLNAIDKFDFNRGFRFSTYATHAVQRHFFRLMHRQQRRAQREFAAEAELLQQIHQPVEEQPQWNLQAAGELIRQFDDCLNSRERAIIEDRFGLTGAAAETLKEIAERVGLSKERVRQLQMAAILKLQQLARQLNLQPEMG